jgi:hypothetical protein
MPLINAVPKPMTWAGVVYAPCLEHRPAGILGHAVVQVGHGVDGGIPGQRQSVSQLSLYRPITQPSLVDPVARLSTVPPRCRTVPPAGPGSSREGSPSWSLATHHLAGVIDGSGSLLVEAEAVGDRGRLASTGDPQLGQDP